MKYGLAGIAPQIKDDGVEEIAHHLAVRPGGGACLWLRGDICLSLGRWNGFQRCGTRRPGEWQDDG